MTNERADFWGGDPEGGLTPEPVYYSDGEEEPEVLEDDGGVSDAERIVRVWVDDGRLQKVRVSPNWYAKLTRGRKATLSQVMTVVLQMAHVGVAAPTDAAPPDIELTPEFRRSLPELSEESLAKVLEHHALLQARFEQAKQEWHPPVPSGQDAQGRSGGVRVTLDARGHATRVDFDDVWLETAQAGDIAAGVMRAAQEAYSRDRPVVAADELSPKMAREYEYLRQVMETIMTPKERR